MPWLWLTEDGNPNKHLPNNKWNRAKSTKLPAFNFHTTKI